MGDLVAELRPHRLTGDDAPVSYRARHVRALCDRIEQLEAALEPFCKLADAYPRPRIAVDPVDTIIFSSRGVQVTLADLDRARSAGLAIA